MTVSTDQLTRESLGQWIFRSISFAFFLCSFTVSYGQERPNILWLVVEDMSPYLSFYNNPYTQTPALDQLAAEGLVFEKAYSNGSQCSPARSTLISGIYAPMLGTDWHREQRAVPTRFFYPNYLKKAGYYCTNNSKQDYNTRKVPKDLWHASNKKASYLNRPDKSKPFFAVFNYNGTHTKRIATRNIEGRNERSIDPASISLPPYLPDEKRIRDDIAWHYDAVSIMDNWIAKKLKELEESGEADNTIVFFYSDHGGCLPRAKAFVYETGTQIPLVVRFPEKWKQLAGGPLPNRSKKLVGFIDFFPTIMNIIGEPIPGHCLGQAFLGENIPNPPTYSFHYRANQEQSFIPSRAITDGSFRLIWNFNTAYPNGVRQSYQWQMPSYQGWDDVFRTEELSQLKSRFWKPMEALEFYHTEVDPYEVNNLIDDPKYQEKIQEMKTALLEYMIEHEDLGLYPWSMRRKNEVQPFYDYVRSSDQNVEELIRAAAFASTAQVQNIDSLGQLLTHKNPAIRYWACRGIQQLIERRVKIELPAALKSVFQSTDEYTENRIAAAEILVKVDQDKAALDFIMEQVEANYFIAYASLQNLGQLAAPAKERILSLLGQAGIKQFYIRSALINIGHWEYNKLYPSSK
ncbi:MAG: sulfatase-like hydrolase/transferase [Bacteroidota bacterium]